MDVASADRRLAAMMVLCLACSDAPGDSGNPYNGPYYGGLHSHTTYARPNYAGTPLDAYHTARSYVLPGTQLDINTGTDWWAVTDYYLSLASQEGQQHWAETLRQAAEVREEGFPAIVGWEWSNIAAGTSSQRDHVGCFPINQTTPPLPPLEEMLFLPGFLATVGLANNPHVCSFNHPELRGTDEPLPAFDEFRYDAAADEFMSLIDVRGFRGYFQALNRGWHLSPTRDEDNKDWNWGLKLGPHGQQRRIGVFARSNSVDAIMEGLRNGSTFATADKSVSVWMKAGDHFMGTVIRGLQPLELSLGGRDRESAENVPLPYFPVICEKLGCSPPPPELAEQPQVDSPYFTSAQLYTNGGTRADREVLPLSSGKILREWNGLHSTEFDEIVTVSPAEDGSHA
ncbi:MAG: hypothetical protein HYV07_30460 [Deltaproteobacteria bacterium]|nr:hypothetical protein [Deltaproteobacteria bacterium]